MIRKGFSRGRGSLDPRICSIVRGLANQTIHTSENSSYNPSQATSHFVQPVPTFCNQLDTINVLDSSVIPYETKLEVAEIFGAHFDLLEKQEIELNQNFKSFVQEFSSSEQLYDRARRRGKRRGISDGEHHLHKMHEKLKKELPLLLFPFFEDHDLDIYDDTIALEVYEKGHQKYNIRGIRKYKAMYSTAITKIKIELNNPTFTILRSRVDRKLGQIEIKWRITGQTKLNATISKIINTGTGEKEYQMISTLTLNEKGKIFSHVISDMEINSGPKIGRSVAMGAFAARLGLGDHEGFSPSFFGN